MNARRNMLEHDAYAAQKRHNGFGANALKAHIDAIAASIPSAAPGRRARRLDPAGPRRRPRLRQPVCARASTSLSRFGIWELTGTCCACRRSAHHRHVDQRTAELQKMFTQIRMPPVEQMKALALAR